MSNKFQCENMDECTIVFSSETPIYVSSKDNIHIFDENGIRKMDNGGRNVLHIKIINSVTFDILSSSPIQYKFKGTGGKIRVIPHVKFDNETNLKMFNVEASPEQVKKIPEQVKSLVSTESKKPIVESSRQGRQPSSKKVTVPVKTEKELQALIIEINLIEEENNEPKVTRIERGVISVEKSGNERIIQLNQNPIYKLDFSVARSRPAVDCNTKLQKLTSDESLFTQTKLSKDDNMYKHGCTINPECILPKTKTKFPYVFFKNDSECKKFARLFDDEKKEETAAPAAAPAAAPPKVSTGKAAPAAAVAPSAKNSCTAIHAPVNRAAVSCYYDSLFFALFALATPFVTENLFNKTKCSKNQENRKLCSYLYTIYQKFTSGADAETCPVPPIYLFPDEVDKEGDDAEVLIKIFTRLNIETVRYTHNKTYKMAEQSVYDRNVSENTSPIIKLLHHTIQEWSSDQNNFIVKTNHSERTSVRVTDESGEAIRTVEFDKEENIEKYNIKDLTFLVIQNIGKTHLFNVTNRQGQPEVRAEITYNENNKIQNIDTLVKNVNPRLRLNKVTCKSGGAAGGHYICYFRCKENWYQYNDLGGITRKTRDLTIDPSFKWSLLFFDDTAPSI